MRLSATEVREHLLPLISIDHIKGHREALDILQECAYKAPSTVLPCFDAIFATLMDRKLDGLTSDYDQTLEGFFGVLQTLWRHVPESSRAACFSAVFANVNANTAYISEEYPDPQAVPSTHAENPMVRVRSRWNTCAWHYILGMDQDRMFEGLGSVAAMLTSSADVASIMEKSDAFEVLGRAREKAAPYVDVGKRHLVGAGIRGGYVLSVLANIASPVASSDPPFDKPGMTVGPEALMKGMRLYATDAAAVECGVRHILNFVTPWSDAQLHHAYATMGEEDLADDSDSDSGGSDDDDRRGEDVECSESNERYRAQYVALGAVEVVRTFMDSNPDAEPSLIKKCAKLLRKLEAPTPP